MKQRWSKEESLYNIQIKRLLIFSSFFINQIRELFDFRSWKTLEITWPTYFYREEIQRADWFASADWWPSQV